MIRASAGAVAGRADGVPALRAALDVRIVGAVDDRELDDRAAVAAGGRNPHRGLDAVGLLAGAAAADVADCVGALGGVHV